MYMDKEIVDGDWAVGIWRIINNNQKITSLVMVNKKRFQHVVIFINYTKLEWVTKHEAGVERINYSVNEVWNVQREVR